MATIDVTAQSSTATTDTGAVFTNVASVASTGTGVFDSFLVIQNNGTEQGYNTDGSPLPLDDKQASHTNAILLSSIPVVTGDGQNGTVAGTQYLEFRLDINQNGSANQPQLISLDQLKIYQESSGNLLTDFAGETPKFDLGDNTVLLNAQWDAGSGKGDYVILVPLSNFDTSGADPYVYLYSQFGAVGGDYAANSGFEEWGVIGSGGSGLGALSVVKQVHDIDGNTQNLVVDHAGQQIDYSIEVGNTGTGVLTLTSVTDQIESLGATAAVAVTTTFNNATYNLGDTNHNNLLDPGEHWQYTATYTVQQADIDHDGYGTGAGGAPGDGFIDNLATASATGVPDATDTASVAIDYKPSMSVDKTVVSVDDVNGDGLTDAGDIIHYNIHVANTGNVTLTGVTVTDPLTGDPAGGLSTLNVGSSEDLVATYTLTQADIDNHGSNLVDLIQDDKITNTATADSDQTSPVSDSVDQPIDYKPSMSIVKTVVSVDDVNGDGLTDAGDIIHYNIHVANTGDVTLTGVTVTDPMTGDPTGGLSTLAVGSSEDLAATYTLTQADIDNHGSNLVDLTQDDKITNTATADSDQTTPVSDSVDQPIDYKPSVDLTKTVLSVTGGHADHVGDVITYQITVENTGDVTLTGVKVTDALEGYSLATLDNSTVTGDNGNHVLDVGETWTYTTTHTLTQADLDNNWLNGGDGVFDNTATVTDNQNVTDYDTAHVLLGPGVRTPGFWAQKTWQTFWDGNANNQPKQAGTDGFASGEITYAVDSNHDTHVTSADKAGLLIGDYNLNGVQDIGENVLFISTADALTLLNASDKQVQDGRYMLGRDVVATWLNYLEGNAIGNGSAGTARHDIDDAIKWLEYTQAKPGAIENSADFHTLSVADDLTSSSAVKTSSAIWSGPVVNVPLLGQAIDLSASHLHTDLDHYNNLGFV
ncbi:DUF11 domain-containing protein [Bradyrhizobium sp. USDA 3458]|uniref:DUF7507 domain-containing protein n=1 Tax=Bradyrhizobium sp. USDA 3458 TaxID=2591461 RepID=UPI0011421AA3|nr:DUF11 domain-containing protein [Bradyrhizobium sp. USDA 3458]